MKECGIFYIAQYCVRYFGSSIPEDKGGKVIQLALTNALYYNVITIKMQ